jgi:D-amino peptidase
MVATKVAETPESARLLSPTVVKERLTAATKRALGRMGSAKPLRLTTPVRVRLRLSDITITQLMEAIPGVKQTDGYTVEFTAPSMREAYRLIRLMYRYISV